MKSDGNRLNGFALSRVGYTALKHGVNGKVAQRIQWDTTARVPP